MPINPDDEPAAEAPKCRLPDGTKNPAYAKWYRAQNRAKINAYAREYHARVEKPRNKLKAIRAAQGKQELKLNTTGRGPNGRIAGKVRELHQRGKDMDRIALSLGLPQSRVLAALQELGLAPNPPQSNNWKP
jgi:hypothetical protein